MSVCVCVTSHFYLGTYVLTPYTYVLTRCHVTDINHVLKPCHVTEINYVDRGVAARTPLQYSHYCRVVYTVFETGLFCFFCVLSCVFWSKTLRILRKLDRTKKGTGHTHPSVIAATVEYR